MKSFRLIPLLLLLLSAGLYAGCADSSPSPPGPNSPSVVGYSIVPSNEGQDNTQRITIAVRFDKPIAVGKNAKKDFDITIADKALDSSIADYSVSADPDDPSGLLVEIFALPTAATPTEGSNYFAVREASLAITAQNGSLSAITDEKKDSLVQWTDIHCVIPTGLSLNTVSSVKGDAASGTKAKVTIEVENVAQIRSYIWLQLLQNGSPVLKEGYETKDYSYVNKGSIPIHSHGFLTLDPKDYAEMIVDGLEEFIGSSETYAGRFSFTQNNNQVVIESLQAVDGETLDLVLYEYPVDQVK